MKNHSALTYFYVFYYLIFHFLFFLLLEPENDIREILSETEKLNTADIELPPMILHHGVNTKLPHVNKILAEIAGVHQVSTAYIDVIVLFFCVLSLQPLLQTQNILTPEFQVPIKKMVVLPTW